MSDMKNVHDYLATGEWPRDVRGKMFKVGQKVAKAVALNSSGAIGVKVCVVTHVSSTSVRLDHAKGGNVRHDRLAIIEDA